VQAAGLKAIVSYGPLHVSNPDVAQAEVDKNVAAIVERVGKHPAVYGYYLRDEPNASLFPALARYAAAIRKADADARPYINLFPNYANAEQLGTPTYEAYLEKFIATVQPPFVSYDHYALMDDGSLRDGYFQNLLAVRKAAIEHNLPFWNIVLSNSTSGMPNPPRPACASRRSPRWPRAGGASATSPTSRPRAAITGSRPSTSSATGRPPGTCCAG